MSDAKELLAEYLRGERQTPSSEGWSRFWQAARMVAVVALTLAGLGLIFWHLWRAWQLDQWKPALLAIPMGFYVPMAGGLLIPRVPRLSPNERLRLTIFRRAITLADARYTPPASRMVPQASDDDHFQDVPSATSLWLLKGTLGQGAVIGLVGALYLFTAMLWDTLSQDFAMDSAFFIASLGALAVLIIAGLVVLVRSVRSTSARVTLDEIGARWREGRHERRIEWSRVRAFLQVERIKATASSPMSITAYLLDTPEGILAWVAGETNTEHKTSRAARRLARQLPHRIGLPLRDATNLVRTLTRPDADLAALYPLRSAPSLGYV